MLGLSFQLASLEENGTISIWVSYIFRSRRLRCHSKLFPCVGRPCGETLRDVQCHDGRRGVLRISHLTDFFFTTIKKYETKSQRNDNC